MTSTLPKQVRQMKQGDRWRKVPIRVDHPDQPGLGYPYLIDGDDTDGMPAPGYSHQIVQEGDCCTGSWKEWGDPQGGIGLPGTQDGHTLNVGAQATGYQSPPDSVGWAWWWQFRFPIDVPIGTQLTGAAILSACAHHNMAGNSCNAKWRLFGEASTEAFEGHGDCHADRSEDQQTPVLLHRPQDTTVWIPPDEGEWKSYTITTLVQAFIDRETYSPYDPVTAPNDGWLGFGVRYQPPSEGFKAINAWGYADAFTPAQKALAPILAFPYGEEVPGQAGTRFCVATEPGRIHQIRMEKLGVE